MNGRLLTRDQRSTKPAPKEEPMIAPQNKLDVLFRAADGGYIFRAPNPWLVGEARYYFATADQKARLVKIMDIPQWAIGAFWLVFFALCFGGGTFLLYYISGRDDPDTADIAMMFVLALIGVLLPLPLIGIFQRHRLRPILSELKPTNERISLREVGDAMRRATSVRDYARNSMLSGVAFGMMMLNVGLQLSVAITKGKYAALVLWSVAAILFCYAMVKNARLAMSKADGSQPNGI